MCGTKDFSFVTSRIEKIGHNVPQSISLAREDKYENDSKVFALVRFAITYCYS